MTKIEALEKARRVREQKKVVDMLYELDHAFISREGVEKLTKPFGFMGTTYVAKANPQDFKGLSLYDKDGNAIPEMEGQDASTTAEQICKHLGLDYIPQHGRGSQLRVCAPIPPQNPNHLSYKLSFFFMVHRV